MRRSAATVIQLQTVRCVEKDSSIYIPRALWREPSSKGRGRGSLSACSLHLRTTTEHGSRDTKCIRLQPSRTNPCADLPERPLPVPSSNFVRARPLAAAPQLEFPRIDRRARRYARWERLFPSDEGSCRCLFPAESAPGSVHRSSALQPLRRVWLPI